MKRIKHFLRAVILVISLLFTANAEAQVSDSVLTHMDSVRFSLITCGPGEEIYSLYGHTALRYQDFSTGEDLVINYGIFSFQQKFFILRFMFGITDYQMDIEPFLMFRAQYAAEGRWVKEQTLNLTRQEKWSILNALALNSRPENRIYRYNYFYNNCTTKVRDLIFANLSRTTNYSTLCNNTHEDVTFRSSIHQWNENHRWSRFGKDLLLGVLADKQISYADREFLPDTLRKDFGEIKVSDGKTTQNLVSSTHYLLKADSRNSASDTSSIWDTLTPTVLFAFFLVLTFIVCAIEYKCNKKLWFFDLVWLTLSGLAGLALFIMIFSKHPTVSLNLQILLLNPINLLMVYKVCVAERQHIAHRYWKIYAVFLIIFLAGGIFQHYAEGMYLLALSLLIRSIFNCKYQVQRA